ncbi:MAG: pentapeptide repeat-containing protein [Elainellaceae cyanobacterium]
MMVEIDWVNPVAIAASSSAIKVQDGLDTNNKDFAGQSLVQLELSGADLAGADFSDADLRGAVFNGVNLRGANLQRADLSDAILYVTDLTNADLTDANLNSTMLLMSRLKDAKIEGADFTYSAIDREQLFHLCKRASGVNSLTGADTRESLECS